MKEKEFWAEKLGILGLKEGARIKIRSREYVYKNKILREKTLYSRSQSQTKDTFAFKWGKTGTYDSDVYSKFMKKWLTDKYLGGNFKLLDRWLPAGSRMLDAGCGSCFSSLLLFGDKLNEVNYLGVDISESLEIARSRFKAMKIKGEFLQADLTHLPFSGPTFDFIFSEGVLHHTDRPEKVFNYLAGLLNPGGVFLFYIYRSKGPIREFSDDYIRNYLKDLNNSEAWKQLIPLTKLGKALGELKITIGVPENIPFLGIPKGKIELQRLFYWHIFKAFYRHDFSIQEMNHINFDWYRPLNCHRFSAEQIKGWCRNNRLDLRRLHIEEAGISGVVVKNGRY